MDEKENNEIFVGWWQEDFKRSLTIKHCETLREFPKFPDSLINEDLSTMTMVIGNLVFLNVDSFQKYHNLCRKKIGKAKFPSWTTIESADVRAYELPTSNVLPSCQSGYSGLSNDSALGA